MDLPAGLAAKRELVWDRLQVSSERVDDLAAALVDGPWQEFLRWARAKQKEKPWAA